MKEIKESKKKETERRRGTDGQGKTEREGERERQRVRERETEGKREREKKRETKKQIHYPPSRSIFPEPSLHGWHMAINTYAYTCAHMYTCIHIGMSIYSPGQQPHSVLDPQSSISDSPVSRFSLL